MTRIKQIYANFFMPNWKKICVNLFYPCHPRSNYVICGIATIKINEVKKKKLRFPIFSYLAFGQKKYNI
jgi:hypothetical protein